MATLQRPYRGIATIIKTTEKLCKALTQFLPALLPVIPEPERTALLALQTACTNLLNMSPLPGPDNDPTTTT